MIAILEEATAASSGNSNAYNDEKISTLNAQATETLTNASEASHGVENIESSDIQVPLSGVQSYE